MPPNNILSVPNPRSYWMRKYARLQSFKNPDVPDVIFQAFCSLLDFLYKIFYGSSLPAATT